MVPHTRLPPESRHPFLEVAEHLLGIAFGAAAGAAIGSVLGVVGGPAGMVTGGMSGALAGGLAGKAIAASSVPVTRCSHGDPTRVAGVRPADLHHHSAVLEDPPASGTSPDRICIESRKGAR